MGIVRRSEEDNAMKKCPACQAENSDDTVFCKNCGLQISENIVKNTTYTVSLIRCPKCGKTNPFGTSYCGNCGQPLTQEAADQLSGGRNQTFRPKNESNGCLTAILVALCVPVIIIIVSVLVISICGYIEKSSGASSNSSARVTTGTQAVSKQTATKTSSAASEISAQDLLVAYDENEIAAQKKYDDKQLRVTGMAKNGVMTLYLNECSVKSTS
jgi:uncharacterized membrane protein YvbJ